MFRRLKSSNWLAPLDEFTDGIRREKPVVKVRAVGKGESSTITIEGHTVEVPGPMSADRVAAVFNARFGWAARFEAESAPAQPAKQEGATALQAATCSLAGVKPWSPERESAALDRIRSSYPLWKTDDNCTAHEDDFGVVELRRNGEAIGWCPRNQFEAMVRHLGGDMSVLIREHGAQWGEMNYEDEENRNE